MGATLTTTATATVTVTSTATGTTTAPICHGEPMEKKTAFVTGYRFHVCRHCHRNDYNQVAHRAQTLGNQR